MRQANQIVDKLGNHALRVDVKYHVYFFAPHFIVSELRADIDEICFPSIILLFIHQRQKINYVNFLYYQFFFVHDDRFLNMGKSTYPA